jgi:hypothetical protein
MKKVFLSIYIQSPGRIPARRNIPQWNAPCHPEKAMFNWREPIQQALSCADHAKGDLGLDLTNSEEVTYHISQAHCADYDRKRGFNNGSWNVLLSSGSQIHSRKPADSKQKTE